MSTQINKPKEYWFTLLEQIYEETQTIVSELPCLKYCPECICERQEREKIYFLPFEIEFMHQETGIGSDKNSDNFWMIELPTFENQTLSFGLKSKLQDCPFLSETNRCTIYANRPFDCRSFPLMPIFTKNTIDFELEEYCPLVNAEHTFLLNDFVTLYKRLWQLLEKRLPMSWKVMYWHSNHIIPEIDDPTEHPRYIDARTRLSRYMKSHNQSIL